MNRRISKINLKWTWLLPLQIALYNTTRAARYINTRPPLEGRLSADIIAWRRRRRRKKLIARRRRRRRRRYMMAREVENASSAGRREGDEKRRHTDESHARGFDGWRVVGGRWTGKRGSADTHKINTLFTCTRGTIRAPHPRGVRPATAANRGGGTTCDRPGRAGVRARLSE